jgi:predicted transposase YdaD
MSILSGLVIRNTQIVETIIPEDIMKESAYYQYLRNKIRDEGLTEGLAKGKTEGKFEGIIIALLSFINTRFNSIPKTISQKIKSIRDEKLLLEIQKLAIDAKTKQEFVKAFRAKI